MPQALADKAAGIAYAAKAAAFGVSPRELAVLESRAALRDIAEAKGKAHGVSAQARDWAAIPHRVRTVLVNLGASGEGDAFTRARQPWNTFSADEQVRMASVREELLAGLKHADSLSW
jgi:hypothetical protein